MLGQDEKWTVFTIRLRNLKVIWYAQNGFVVVFKLGSEVNRVNITLIGMDQIRTKWDTGRHGRGCCQNPLYRH